MWLSNLELDAIEGEEMDELAEGYQEMFDNDEKSPHSKLVHMLSINDLKKASTMTERPAWCFII